MIDFSIPVLVMLKFFFLSSQKNMNTYLATAEIVPREIFGISRSPKINPREKCQNSCP